MHIKGYRTMVQGFKAKSIVKPLKLSGTHEGLPLPPLKVSGSTIGMIKWMCVLLVNGTFSFLFLGLDVDNYMSLFAGQSLIWIVLGYTFPFIM